MATIMCLSKEVIANILAYKDITIEDIINFRCVCKKFQNVAKYNSFKEKKFLQRWPTARKHFDKQFKNNEQKESEENKQKNKKCVNFMETGIKFAKELRNFMPPQIEKYFKDISISNLAHFSYVFHVDENLLKLLLKRENDIKMYFYFDEIKNLLTQFSRKTVYDLTEKYYIVQFSNCLMQRMLRMKMEKFEEQPHKVQLLEKSATIMAQKLQSERNVLYSSIIASLHSIAIGVLSNLREKHPDHSIFSTSAENFSYWENNNIDDNYWNETEGMQIIHTLEEYIFGKLNFRRNKSENTEWKTQLKYKCIDYVLEHKYGQEIILFIIYHSVARRLGLRCDIISGYSDNRICLFWQPSYATNSLENVRCFRINSNKFPDCFIKQEPFKRFEVITAKKMQDILLFLIQFDDEYSWKMYSPNSLEYRINTSFHWDMNLKDWSTSLKKIGPHCTFNLTMISDERWVPNIRSEDIKFAVGMIVTHSNQSTDCPAGVIIGWHRYEARFSVKVSVEDRRYNPNIYPLKICSDTKKKQTYYFILTENDEMCYVEEDAITLTTPKWIVNSEIGRYFNKFEGTHYVPNKALAKRFPLDAAVTANVTATETKSQT
ncbi:F-box only protein 21-like isoform X2 [Anoplolepis gracilipes]|uniref:F-box only protein 21-like isoform X2 n=1 Tax=Anoplolepis gracilipes TaxID=354296 RepID=UPI003B9E74D5